MEVPDVIRCCKALLDGDDRGAIDQALRLLAAGGCPLAVRLCLPGCWLRARGPEDLDDFVDSLAWAPGTTAAERCLLLVAASRLHPAALATTDALPPRLLLLAAALAALAQGRLPRAARLLSLCGPRPRVPGYVGDLLQASLAHARGTGGWAPVPAPPGPPSDALALRIASSLGARAATLARRGDLLAALGLLELASSLAPAPPLALLAARLWLLLDAPSEARPLLDALRDRGDLDPTELLYTELLWVRLALEEDAAEEAEARARALLEGGGAEARLALATALASRERWGEAESLLAEAGALAEQPEDRGLRAAILHWRGLIAAARGEEAVPLLREAMTERGALLGPGHPELAETQVALGTALLAAGSPEEACRCYRQALRGLEESLGDEHPRAQIAAASLERAEESQRALELERSLSPGEGSGPVADRLRAFGSYVVLQEQDHHGLLTTTAEGLARGVLLFTTSERAEAFLAQLPAPLARGLRCALVAGGEVPSLLDAQGADGALLHGLRSIIPLPLRAWLP